MFIFASTFIPENNLHELNVPQWFRIKLTFFSNIRCIPHNAYIVFVLLLFYGMQNTKKYETVIKFEISSYVEKLRIK